MDDKTLQRLEALEKAFASQEVQNSELASSNDVLLKEIEALRKAVNTPEEEGQEPELPVLPTDTFIVNKEEYQFVLPVFKKGLVKITAIDALTDEKLLKELVEMKSGVIKKIAK